VRKCGGAIAVLARVTNGGGSGMKFFKVILFQDSTWNNV